MHQRNTDGLKTHAQWKRKHAFERTELGIRQLIKEGRPINFATVSEVSGVARKWLYDQPETRQRIEQLRGQAHPPKSAPPEQRASQASNAAKVKTLLQEVKKLRAENQGLRQHLEDVHGRAIYADEQAERHKREIEALKAENAELKKQLIQYRSQNATTHSNNVINLPQPNTVTEIDKASQIRSEIASLGIKLNSTLNRVIESSPEETVLTAIKTLKEAMTATSIKNPAGWLRRAVEDRWQPNESFSQASGTSDLKLFNEWFPLARAKGLVIASTRSESGIKVLAANNQWMPFAEAITLYPLESFED